MLCLLFLVASYWAVFGAETILRRQDNGRLFETQVGVLRGHLFDRNGELLVVSTSNSDRIVTREYQHPAFDGTLGYYSLMYGSDGLENVYNDRLNNEKVSGTWAAFVREELLHIPRRGEDLMLTYDLTVQKTLAGLMEGQIGAAVILSVPEGELIAMVTRPTYDPDLLDVQWAGLLEDPLDPLLNRALLGQYQPGSLFHLPLMTLAAADQIDVEVVFTRANRPVEIADLNLHCILEPQSPALSLREAYIYGCPAPFQELVDMITVDRALSGGFRFFQSAAEMTLEGYTLGHNAIPVSSSLSDSEMLSEIFGQGEFTLTPLAVAGISASVINAGNAPQPFSMLAFRQPMEEDWTEVLGLRSDIPFTTTENANRLRSLMLDAVQEGAAYAANRPNLRIGGQVALAYAGDERMLAWFTGFVDEEPGSFAIAVLLENVETTSEAARIGGLALEAAVNSLQATRD
jgi:peptidoglycan glycosyltransferase